MTCRAPSETDPLSDPLPADPLPLVARWLEDARACDALRNPWAMFLATVDASGEPDLRTVLCRGFDEARGRFEFFTHYPSPKGRALEARPRASLGFHWDPLERQLRIRGRVERTSRERSDDYFAGRHPLSQLSAWASEQSAPIASRVALEDRMEAMRRQWGDGSDVSIPRPPGWGGYAVTAERIELWVSRAGRLHDRGVWTRDLDAPAAAWSVARLQP